MIKKSKIRLSLLICFLLLFSFVLTPTASLSRPTAPVYSDGISHSYGSYDTRELSAAHPVSVDKISLDSLKLYPGGMPFGIKFITEGVLIIGFCDIKTEGGAVNPSAQAGLKLRDTIIKVNGSKISDASELTGIVESSGGKALTVTYLRDGKELTSTLTPVFSPADGKYKTGIYVRDNGAGIGTVTFIMPETLSFAGLGHGICDSDTGAIIPIQRGSVVDVTISGVVKGLTGSPGEIKGYFSSGKIGTLLSNTQCGVYGVFATLPRNTDQQLLPVGRSSELKEGDAYIYCTLSSNTVEKYSVKIENIRRGETGNKCFNVKITDPLLLAETGGIVQGMSGSPIIQNGKLIGAVTHVLINDPTTGYGIFIENMLNAANIPIAKAS